MKWRTLSLVKIKINNKEAYVNETYQNIQIVMS